MIPVRLLVLLPDREGNRKVKTPYVQEQVNIGSGPPGSKVRWFRSCSDESRFINTVTFDSKEGSPTLVMVHGYGASQGFFFRNFDALASRFRVIAIDQLGLVVEAGDQLLDLLDKNFHELSSPTESHVAFIDLRTGMGPRLAGSS
ncbi:hypothetical protein KSP39_PZI022714 [Platanthera zijinensis]|uniref:AB hydrolase-1 domain-containing protein n=1 Tax=Platanthera zijinensis TaxID=2320716 RepID=A0AAP0FV28_9ASPA